MPLAGANEVLVRVRAAGVDQGVWHLMAGMPYAMRVAGFGLRAPQNPLLGYDVAGQVEAVGAAVTPISGYAALQAVRDHGKVRAEQRVLIIGAGGGVGTFAVQFAKAYGAQVTGVCSTAKTKLVPSIGADHVIDYTREDPVNGRELYDVILDIAGNRPLSKLRRALTPRG